MDVYASHHFETSYSLLYLLGNMKSKQHFSWSTLYFWIWINHY